jgi:acetyl esterase/lipase
VVSVRYRLADPAADVTFRQQVVDVKAAVRWTKNESAYLDIDPTRVFLIGWSAGGHLATVAAVTANDAVMEPDWIRGDSSVRGAISLAAPLDIPATVDTVDVAAFRPAPEEMADVIGCPSESLDECPDRVADRSHPASWADPADPPIYLAIGDQDPISDPRTNGLDAHALLADQMGEELVMLDLVDTGPTSVRMHSPDLGLNIAAVDTFLALAG